MNSTLVINRQIVTSRSINLPKDFNDSSSVIFSTKEKSSIIPSVNIVLIIAIIDIMIFWLIF